MHALITADTIGGVWTYVRELVTALTRRHVQVTLVSFGEIPTSAQTAWMDDLPGLDYRPTAFRLEWMQEAEDDIGASSEYLLSVVREVRPDVLHLNQFCYGSLAIEIPCLVVAHSDVVSWWVAVHGHEPPYNAWIRWYRETVQRGLSHATSVVAPSRFMLESVQRYYTHPTQSKVIYNGRNPNLFNPHITKDDYVVSVGRIWDAGKNVGLLTKADVAVPVYIVGEAQHPDSQAASDQRRGNANVRFVGTQTEVQIRHLLSRAAVYAATSRYEPFGLAPLEAALSRCAIVANDIPTFHEIWGDAALYFRTNDADDLARVLKQLRDDLQLRSTYANRAYNHARAHYTADRMADEYVQLYQLLVPAEALSA
jgi:glycosyltransferase involved in cell wall biosynthesis